MFCYGPDIAQLEACWLSVKRAQKEERISSDDEAVEMFVASFKEFHGHLLPTLLSSYSMPDSPQVMAVKARLNAAMFVALIKSLLPAASEEETCESMHECFQDMGWTLYLKVVHSLEFEEHLCDCLCQLDEHIYLNIIKLIMETCQQDEVLKTSRMANPILASIFTRHQTLKLPKRYHPIISSASLWLLEIKQDELKDFNTYFRSFVQTADTFCDMLFKVIGNQLLEMVGENYKIGVVPKIKNLKPFNSAKHWIHMARLFHNYISPHNWHYINNFRYRLWSVRFMLRCVDLFNIEIFHPAKKPKILRVFRKQDKIYSVMGNRRNDEDDDSTDIDDLLENVEELLAKRSPSKDKAVAFLETFVTRHIVYGVMERLLITCTKANEESKKELTVHFLNMCEQTLLPPDVTLQLYLDICKGSELLKQPDFTQEITTFLNQATDAQMVHQLVPPIVQLCLQSPKNVVYNIIHRVVESKGHIPTLARLLSEVSIICRYKEKTQPSSLLVTCLKSFTKKASSVKQGESITCFVQELVKSPKDALDISEFTSVVIVPLLRPDSIPLQTDLACQLLHTILDSSTTALSCNVTVLAVTLIHFANRYLNSAELIKRDKFFSLLKKLEKQFPKTILSPELDWLKKQLKDFHPLLRIQAAELFHLSQADFSVQGVNHLEKALLQSTCIAGEAPISLATKHLSSLPQTIRYAALVAALEKVLPIISQAEWISVLQVVNSLLKDLFEENNKQQANDSIVLTLRATTDSLVVHQKNSIPTNWNYVLSAYGQAIKHFSTDLAEGSEHRSYAFCEVCRLANALPAESNQHLLPILLQLVDQVLTSPCKDHILMLKVAINGISGELLKSTLQARVDQSTTLPS